MDLRLCELTIKAMLIRMTDNVKTFQLFNKRSVTFRTMLFITFK